MKKLLPLGIFTLTIALTILLILPAAQALDFKISGQLNRAVLWGDNGNDDDIKFVDNDNSSTRFRFTGENEFDNNWKVGFKWENEMQSNDSSDTVIDIGENGDSTDVDFNERHMDIYFQHSKFGKLSLGQGDTASNGTSEVDLSGTDVVNYSSIEDMNGGFNFRDDDDNVITSIGAAFSNFDGLSRDDRIRYDTPKFGPVYFSTSYENGQTYDFAGRFAYQWEGFGKLAAAASWLPADTQREPYKQYSGSVSFLFDFGLNLTFSGANRYDTPDNSEPYNLYGKVGYKMDKWAFSVDYTYSEDVGAEGDEATSIGAAAVFNPWKSVELYACYRWNDLDRDADQRPAGVGNAESINSVMVGTRVKF
ncbi:MAG: porin [Deltaproteobacteria bacterium]|jgi:predicted porin|nr:porin [Deltaproteobacteria bacterium]